MINILPKSEKDAIRKEYHLRVFVVGFAMLSSVFVTAMFAFLPTYFFTTSRYGTFLAQSQSNQANDHLIQVKELEAVVQETNDKIKTLQGSTSILSMRDVFSDIINSKPPGITLTRLSYDFGMSVSKKEEKGKNIENIVLQGKSSDRATLLAFRDALAQKKEFSTIDLPLSVLIKDTDFVFSINIPLSNDRKILK